MRIVQGVICIIMLALVGCGGSAPSPNTDVLTLNPTPDRTPDPDPGPDSNGPRNILLLISDDVGLDASSGYTVGTQLPATPTLDALAAEGLIFDNAWANPACSPTRARILTGRYGYRTGVLAPGNEISLNETSLQAFIDTNVPNTYEHGVFGKWHLAGGSNGGNDNPNLMGIPQFSGLNPSAGVVGDYFSWTQVVNGQRAQNQTYTTTEFVNSAIEWIAGRQQPWFVWVAFNAPHTPFHLPPLDLHGRVSLSAAQTAIDSDPLSYYLASLEAMDTEIARLLASLPEQTRGNTVVIYIGDNGTPRQVV